MIKYSKLLVLTIIFLFIFSNITLCTSVNIRKELKLPKTRITKPIVVWNKTYGGDNLDWGWSVQETTDGGLVITGETASFGSGNFDSWLIKTDSNGNETWNKTFGGLYKDGSRSVRQTIDGGYILGGYADSYGHPGHDAWFIKTDSEGNEEWNTTIGGIASDATFSVIQTSDEGFIGVGYADSYSEGIHDLWLVRTDEYGNEQWNKTIGSSESDTGYSLKECDDGGYIIAGTTQSYGAGYQDAWLIKTDSDGNEEWNKTYGGGHNDWGSVVVITEDGYYLAGDTHSFGPGGYDFWLIKTDKYGNEQWNRTYGESDSHDTGYSFIKTSDGGFAIVGTKTSFSTELTDMWLIKTDINGNMIWNLTIDGGDDEWSYSVDETNDGCYVISGRTNSFGNGNYDFWLLKVKLVEYENQPPTVPLINGSDIGEVGEKVNFSFVSEDNEEDKIYYYVDWGDGTFDDWLGPFNSGEEAILSHAWEIEGTYNIISKAKDIYNEESDWSEPFIIRIGNIPPNKPDVDGPRKGKAGKSYDYTFTATDPDGDDIWYHIGWGDKEIIYIYGPFPSGEELKLNYTWVEKGSYVISCWARDNYDEESETATLEVTMPRIRILQNPFVNWLFQGFKNLIFNSISIV
jgi:predicted secreted protein